jgi:methylated-DNA-[protein]-cysteine S-methyltransferase
MTNPLQFQRAQLATPIGTLSVVTDRDACIRAIDWQDYEERLLRLLSRHYASDYSLHAAACPTRVHDALQAYFAGDLQAITTLAVATGGSPFQRAVWAGLRAIPVGSTRSYGELALQLGCPKAVRAVGLANGANPIGVVVPCHRVIGANGSLTGYAGGLARKHWLLNHEGVTLHARALEPTRSKSMSASV